MQPYDYVVPHDFIDLNIDRPLSFPREIYRDPDNIPLPRVLPAMDPDLQSILLEETQKRLRSDRDLDDMSIHKAGVTIQARGGRFETAAEIRMFAQWGGDVVTMNVGTEIAYARMLGMNYGCLIVISNPAEGVDAIPRFHRIERRRQSDWRGPAGDRRATGAAPRRHRDASRESRPSRVQP